MNETVDATAIEIVPNGRALADSRTPAQIVADARERAVVVAKIIKDQHLFVRINTKDYVKYEGWCTLAAQYGLVPGIAWSRPLPNGGFEAKAELRRMDNGAVVSTAEGECGSQGDGDWVERAAYAQRSMAETRAVSKVCRVSLSWVIVLAGYEATPAEEMPRDEDERPRSTKTATVGTLRRMTAKYRGDCYVCGGVIIPGSEMDFDLKAKKASHAECPGTEAPEEAEQPPPEDA